MQANCPQCGNRISVDDARVPDRPFGVKCPKCQSTVRFPGRASAAPPAAAPPQAAPAASAAALPPVPEEAPRPAPGAATAAHLPLEPMARGEEGRPPLLASARREMGPGDGHGHGLVALPDRTLGAGIALMLSRNGFTVDTLDDWEEGARLLDQGVYGVVATARVAAPAGKSESLYQRVMRLGPDARRRVFLLLVGDEFRSGDGLQAFVALADLVLHSRDASNGDAFLRNAVMERQRLYQAYVDARHRIEAAAG